MTDRHQITAGFIPLLDSALLVVAKEKGGGDRSHPDARDVLGEYS